MSTRIIEFYALTSAEETLLRLAGVGVRISEVSGRSSLSPGQVANALDTLREKIGVQDHSDLQSFAIRHRFRPR